jgi:phosphoribosylformimino-5-aminoimidazole carboxamide ribotide isomerase
MQLIPVVDLARGVAVQARGGDRRHYGPVHSTLAPGRPGDAVALVQAYRDRLAARECYVADLDAIQGGALQRDLLRELARAAAPCGLLVDAGGGSSTTTKEVLALGAASSVIGLETLRTLEDLRESVALATPERVIFSLDLRHGRPMLSPDAAEDLRGLTVEELAARAIGTGVRTLVVLDVGRVGTAGGLDLELLRRLRHLAPAVRLLAGGGVAGPEDLHRLSGAGCDGALVATALHTGGIGQSRANASRQVADWP